VRKKNHTDRKPLWSEKKNKFPRGEVKGKTLSNKEKDRRGGIFLKKHFRKGAWKEKGNRTGYREKKPFLRAP